MSQPLTIQPGPGQRANESPIVAPAPPPGRKLNAPAPAIRRSLRASVCDAMAWAVMQGAGTSYVAPFVILVGSSLFQLAAISGLPSLATGLLQLPAAHMTDVLRDRKRIILFCAMLQTVLWAVFAVGVLVPFSVGYWILLAAFIGHVGAGAFLGPAWQSLMGDLVPQHRRGRYFGLRNSMSMIVQVSAFFAAGWWLAFCEEAGTTWVVTGRTWGFFSVFVLAGFARLTSVFYLRQMFEPEYQRQDTDHFTLREFIKRAPRAHFGRFVIYSMLVHIAFGLNGPYLGWYLLDQLEFSTGQFAMILTTSMVVMALMQPAWGRLIDRMGSKYVLAIGGNMIIFVPLVLLLCHEVWQFVLAMVFDGLASAAFTMSVGNYFYDVVTPPKRARCVAYNTLFVSMGGAIGAFAGAAIATWVPTPLVVGQLTIGHSFALLLICSSLVRLLASILLLSTFDEFRLRKPAFPVVAG